MKKGGYDYIKYQKGEDFTHILLGEKLPNEKEIQRLKIAVIKENKLHRKDEIDYEKFRELYLKYGGIMPEEMFAEKILDIKKSSLVKIRPKSNEGEEKNQKKKQRKTQILLYTKMKKREIKSLKKKVIAEKNLCEGKEISLQDFEEMYNEYEHILARSEFAKEILGVNFQSFNKLRNGKTKKIKIFIDTEQIEEELKLELSNEKVIEKSKVAEKQSNNSRKNIRRILEEFQYTPRNIMIIKKYIEKQRREFVKKENFERSDLDFMEECIEFVQGGQKEIEFFAKVCISFREYQKASGFISRNIDNEGIHQEEKIKLRELQKSIDYSIKKEKAVHMIFDLNITDVKEIAKITGLLETEVLKIRRQNIPEKRQTYQEEK